MAKKASQDDGGMISADSSVNYAGDNEPLTALNLMIDTYVMASQAAQKERDPFREQAVRMFLDDQLAGVEIKENWGRVQFNKIYPAIMQELAIQVQRWQNSDVQVRKIGGSNEDDDAELIEGRLRWLYFKGLDVPELMMRNILEAKVGGNYVNRVFWDDEFDWDDVQYAYIGRVCAELVDIKQFVIDPECGSDLSKARYMGTHRRIELDWALRNWPDDEDRIIEAAKSETEQEDRDRMGASDYEAYVNPSTAVTIDGGAQPGEGGERPLRKGPGEGALAQLVLNPKRRRISSKEDDTAISKLPRFITVTELYFLDFEQTEDGKPKYPFGRMVLRVGRGNKAIILNDKPVNDEDAQRWWMRDWPFLIGMNMPLPGNTWRGMDSGVMLKHIQDAINDVFRHWEMHVRLFADPRVMAEDGALPKDTNQGEQVDLQSCAGAYWKLADGALRQGKFRVDPPPPGSETMFRLMDLLQQQFDNLSGVHEIIRGQQGAKMTATQSLQLQTNSRLRVGSQAWYADQYVVRLLTLAMIIDLRHRGEGDQIEIIDRKGGEELKELTREAIDMEYGLEMRVVTALPWDNERTQEKAIALLESFGGSLSLAKTVLETFSKDIPSLDVEAILQQMSEAADAQAEAEAAANAPPPAAEPPTEEIDVSKEAPDAPA